MINSQKLSREALRTIVLDQNSAFWEKELGTEREKLKDLLKFIESPHAIVISGLRRAGKSTLLAQLAHQMGRDKYYFINFEDERFLGFKANDWNYLYEVLIEQFGERKLFLLDEIQNIKGWERFVRRMIDEGFKFYLTGSNASLLSQELGTKLTGRYIPVEVFPFSFGEFIKFYNFTNWSQGITELTTQNKAQLSGLFQDYLKIGGIPDAIKYRSLEIHKTLYNDVLYRDVANRYKIKETQALKEMTFYLISNVSCLISYNKLKEFLKLGSVNTVHRYVNYLSTSWLILISNVYDYSVKRQQIASKKVYCIDTGLVNSIGFSFSENRGKLLENLVFLHLRRSGEEVYYYSSKSGKEVDFYLPKSKKLIQVAQSLGNQTVYNREIEALKESMQELGLKEALILSEDDGSIVMEDRSTIEVMSLWQWLLSTPS